MLVRKNRLSRYLIALPALFLVVAISACSDGDDDGENAPPGGMIIIDGTDPGDEGDNGDGDDDAVQETLNADGTSTFELKLTAELQAPPLDLPDAEATANLTIDKTSGTITGTVTSTGLTGAISAAHIHSGYAGENGPPILVLEFDIPADGIGAPVNMNSVQVPAGAGLDTDALASLANGELYINLHTAANPGGEVRGQIIPIGVLLEDSELSNAEVVNATVTSDATGFGFTTVNEDTGNFAATVFLSNIDDATAVEIRRGAEGVDGELIMMMIQDATDAGVWRTPAASVLTATQITDLTAEALYFNVTSSRAPLGEIRGQL